MLALRPEAAGQRARALRKPEWPIVQNAKAKRDAADDMKTSMVAAMRDFNEINVAAAKREWNSYNPNTKAKVPSWLIMDSTTGNNFVIYNGDCVELSRQLPDNSIGYTIFSPPFASLYTYSASRARHGQLPQRCGSFSSTSRFSRRSCTASRSPVGCCRSIAC